jgi:hypothetical protein
MAASLRRLSPGGMGAGVNTVMLIADHATPFSVYSQQTAIVVSTMTEAHLVDKSTSHQ